MLKESLNVFHHGNYAAANLDTPFDVELDEPLLRDDLSLPSLSPGLLATYLVPSRVTGVALDED
jgi:hypothetical protein